VLVFSGVALASLPLSVSGQGRIGRRPPDVASSDAADGQPTWKVRGVRERRNHSLDPA